MLCEAIFFFFLDYVLCNATCGTYCEVSNPEHSLMQSGFLNPMLNCGVSHASAPGILPCMVCWLRLCQERWQTYTKNIYLLFWWQTTNQSLPEWKVITDDIKWLWHKLPSIKTGCFKIYHNISLSGRSNNPLCDGNMIFRIGPEPVQTTEVCYWYRCPRFLQ